MKASYSVLLAVLGAGICVAGTFGGAQTASAQALPAFQLESDLGLPDQSLTGFGHGPASNGSAITQSLTFAAGDILTLDYNFLTHEDPSGGLGTIDDFAFIGLTPLYLSTLADVVGATQLSTTGFPSETGPQSYSVQILTGGTYTLELGVVNVTDNTFDSGLLVDNIRINGVLVPNGSFETGDGTNFSTFGTAFGVGSSFGSGPTDGTQALLITTVPEPSTCLLLAMGMVGASVMSRRRTRNRRALAANA